MRKRTQLQKHVRRFQREGGGSRHTIKRVLGRKLDNGGAIFEKEKLLYEDIQDGPRTVEIVQTNTCSFGHTIDDKVRVSGICEIGNEVLCSSEGCMLQCAHCGAVVCRRHSVSHNEKVYCINCRWIYYWRRFWRLD